jgi:hypothetical protein
VHRAALRLNADGSLDFGTCHELRELNGGSAVAYFDENDDPVADSPISADYLPEEVTPGDVIRLPAPPADEWKLVNVVIEGEYTTRAGQTIASTVEGLFDRDDLEVGEWSWARSGIFIGTVLVEACDLND